MNRQGHTYLAAVTAGTYIALTAPTVDQASQATMTVAASILYAGIPDLDLKLPVVTHRGATHRAWSHLILIAATYILATAALPAYTAAIVTGSTLGLVSHAVGDMMTPAGLAYLSPIIRRDLRILPFRWRAVPEGPWRENPATKKLTRRVEPWHKPYRVRFNRDGHPIRHPYLAISQEHALLVITVLYAAVVYLGVAR
jgi:inner membrane protein